MRGGFLHNNVLVRGLCAQCGRIGARAEIEVPVRCGQRTRFIDVVVRNESEVIALEVECDARRIEWDVEKAMAFGADEFWIVVPDAHLACRVRRQVDKYQQSTEAGVICVLTYGQALERLRKCFSLISAANTQEKQITNPGGHACRFAGSTFCD